MASSKACRETAWINGWERAAKNFLKKVAKKFGDVKNYTYLCVELKMARE